MTLGTQPQQGGTAMPRRGFFESIRGLAAAVVLMLSAMVLLAGCGGGSSNNPGNNDDDNGTAGTAIVTGRLVNRYAGNAAVIGATITYARGGASQASAVTGADGSFSLTITSGIGISTLHLTDPSGTTFYDAASVQGTTYNIKSTGVPIRAINSGETVSLGEIGVFSDTGPPPPPVFP